jgi:hypothetical protein
MSASKKTRSAERRDAPMTGSHNEAFIKLFAHAVELVGSEKRARAMLANGTLKIKLPRSRREPGSKWANCGAYARSTGKPCQAPGNGRGGRCKMHGGKSTGPRTEEGIKRLQEAVRARWREWRAAQGLPQEW